jgi:ATP-dependent RNA helicase RhlE
MLAFPNRIEVAANNPAADGVSHVVHPVDRSKKAALLSFLIASRGWRQILVFTRTKRGADRLTQKLKRDGIQAVAIHSDKTQTLRTRALADFKRGAVRVLVATDIAARGLDIDQLPHVVNFELPNVAEDYVHRIGRTGRAGNKGDAVSLVSVHESQLLNGIERLLALDIPEVVISGFEPNTPPAAEPRPSRNGGKLRPVRHGSKRYARGMGRRSRGITNRENRAFPARRNSR